MILAKNIRKVAREYGTNIKEISKQLGVLSNNLSRTINSPNMTVEDLQKIASAIGCEVEEFYLVDKATKVHYVCPRCGEHFDISFIVTKTPSKKR